MLSEATEQHAQSTGRLEADIAESARLRAEALAEAEEVRSTAVAEAESRIATARKQAGQDKDWQFIRTGSSWCACAPPPAA